MGPGQFFVAWVGSGWVSHLWFGFGSGKFPNMKIPNLSIFFPSDQKNLIRSGQKVPGSKMGRPVIYCGSKVCSGRVKALAHSYLFRFPMSPSAAAYIMLTIVSPLLSYKTRLNNEKLFNTQ